MTLKLTREQLYEANELWSTVGDSENAKYNLACEVISLRAQIALIARTFWTDVPEDEQPYDLVADLIERHDRWLKEAEKLSVERTNLRQRVESLEAFKRSVDEALNSGDGSYRP